MSNTKTFAECELEILVKSAPLDDRPVIEEFIPEILALCEKFGESGQSGGSAPYTANALANAIKKLCLQEPICPIMGIDEEWGNVSWDDEPLWQNKRCYALFKDKEGIKYNDAVIKITSNGTTWSGRFWMSREDYLTGDRDLMMGNSLFIKGFPFTPKTFYIDVIEEEVAKDDWEMYVKDKSQLDEVFKYYDKKNMLTIRDRKRKLEKINEI